MKISISQRLRAWLPTILWAGFIFTMSTSEFSASNTINYLYPVLFWLLPFASHDTLMLLHEMIRKGAHLTEYFVFSMLLLHGIRAGRKEWRLQWALIALLAAALYASSDEFHQMFVPGRNASIWDVMIDTTGATLAQVAAYLFSRRRRPEPA
ncbi:MAG: VanZ family protein [Candidatus Acidiferrales bacterium]